MNDKRSEFLNIHVSASESKGIRVCDFMCQVRKKHEQAGLKKKRFSNASLMPSQTPVLCDHLIYSSLGRQVAQSVERQSLEVEVPGLKAALGAGGGVGSHLTNLI